MHKSFRSQRNQITNTDETVRMASYLQRSIASGRSSYVEMQAVSRIVAHNIKAMINSLGSTIKNHRSVQLLAVSSLISNAYEFTLTSNGLIRQGDLEDLISADQDISLLLAEMEYKIYSNSQVDIDDYVSVLKELINTRLRLVERFKA